MSKFLRVGQQRNLSIKVSIAAMVYLLVSVTASGASLSGEVRFSGKGAERAKLSDIVVYYQPKTKYLNPALSSPLQIGMKKKAYNPRVSVVPTGSEIQVTNYDRILHNAFSPSGGNSFDLGFYGTNQNKVHQLNEEGVVRIFCNVHFHMVAYVLVLDTPFYSRPDSDGKFNLVDLPEGEGELVFWHERADRIVQKFSLPYSEKIDIDIPITKRRIPEHNTKSGDSYKKQRRSRRN